MVLNNGHVAKEPPYIDVELASAIDGYVSGLHNILLNNSSRLLSNFIAIQTSIEPLQLP